MKHILTIFFFLIFFTTQFIAQDDIDSSYYGIDSLYYERDTNYHIDVFKPFWLSYDQKYYINSFNNQLKSFNQFNFQQPVNAISFGSIVKLSSTYTYNGFDSYTGLTFYLPDYITINDSIKQQISGYEVTFPFWGQTPVDLPHLKLFFTEGISFGRIKLKNDQRQSIKNPFYGPYAGFILQSHHRKINFFIKAIFDLDVSSGKWRKVYLSRKGTPDIFLHRFNQSGLNVSFGINFYPTLGKDK